MSTAMSLEVWHCKLAHMNCKALKEAAAGGAIRGMQIEVDTAPTECLPCGFAKITRMSYTKLIKHWTSRSYHKLISDVCFVGVDTYSGKRHFQLVVDEATRSVCRILLREKGEASANVRKLIKFLTAQGRRVVKLVCDQGRKLVNNKMRDFLHARVIISMTVNLYAPDENSLAA
ncbi:hypothetical protein PybrP1_008175 [[Pythium] brassicae (nom. inval.)]|nr:hypothetical protein PybrP1_008175 [[Pythium] brassicae (nom. inval.)]